MSETRLIRCLACGTTNRVPLGPIERGLTPVCGRCKARMSIDLGPVIVGGATFAAEVDRSPVPALLDLWAPWCHRCRMIAPMLEELAKEWAGRLRVAKVNVDGNPARRPGSACGVSRRSYCSGEGARWIGLWGYIRGRRSRSDSSG